MSDTSAARCRRLLRRALTLITPAVLTACGGSGGGTDPVVGDDPVVAQWQLALTRDASGTQRVVAWDPDRPANARQEFLTDAGLATTVAAETVDATTGTRTVVGAAMALYVQDGRLFRVGLRDSARLQPMQVSSLTGICALDAAHALQADGALAAVALRVTGASGGCDADRTVRSDASAGTDAFSGSGERLLAVLPDAQGRAVALLQAVDQGGGSERLALRNPDGTNLRALAGQPASGGGANAVMAWARGPSGRAWVATGGQLRQLDWYDGQPSLAGTAALSLQEDAGRGLQPGSRALADLDGSVYLLDGTALRRWRQGTAETLVTLSGNANFSGLGLASSHVVYGTMETAFQLNSAVLSLPKAGGSPIELAASQSAYVVRLEAMGEDTAVVRMAFTGLSAMPVTGGNGPFTGGLMAGLRRSAQRPAGVPPVVTGLVECLPVATGCDLRVQALDGRPAVALGTIATAGLGEAWGLLTEGLPAAWVVNTGSGPSDAWSWSPARPSQVDRVTHHL